MLHGNVDGYEPLVIRGMEKTLSDPRLKSIAIEINNDLSDHINALEKIKLAGFDVLEDEKFINHAYLAVGSAQNYFLVRH